MIDALIQNTFVLVQFIMLCFMFTGIGLFVSKFIPATFTSRGETIFFSFGLGTGITGYAVFILSAAQLLFPAALYAILALLLALAVAGWRSAECSLSLRSLRPDGGVESVAAVFLAILLAVLLVLTLAPETGRDALTYHLAAPKLFLEHHGFYFIPGNPLAHGPFHTEMLFLLALFLKGDVLAKLVNFAFFLAILLAIRQYALAKMGQNTFPYLCMLIFAMIPSVFVEAHTAYIDLAVTFSTLSALYAFLTWYERKERGWLILCALFTGIALSSKFTTLFIPFIGCLGVLWRHHDDEKGNQVFPDLALFISVTLLFGAPHYIKNWLLTGNPFYPFLYGMFGGKGWEQEQARLFDAMVLNIGMGRRAIDYLLLPWNLSIHAQLDTMLFDGFISPLFLLVLPFLAGMRKIPAATRSVMVYCLLLFLFWASASQQIRFLIPILPLLALLTGEVLTYYRGKKIPALFLSVVVSGCLIVNANLDIQNFMKYKPTGVVLGLESRDSYLERNLATYRMYRFVNTNLPPDARLYLIYMKNWTFLCNRDCYSDYMFEYYTLRKIVADSTTPEEVYGKIKGMGFTHIMYDVNYITGEKSMLSAEQKLLFREFQEKHLTLVKNERFYYLYRL